MPWKKSYHHLLKGDASTMEDMMKRMRDLEMSARDMYLVMLVR